MVKHPLPEETVPSPRTAPALCDDVALLSRELSPEGMPRRRGRMHDVPWPKKSVGKNSARISHENCTIPVLSGSASPAIAMTCAAVASPRRFNELKTPPLVLRSPFSDARSTITIFHGFWCEPFLFMPVSTEPMIWLFREVSDLSFTILRGRVNGSSRGITMRGRKFDRRKSREVTT